MTDKQGPTSYTHINGRAILLIIASAAAYRHVWRDIVEIGLRDEESSHIFLVPLVAIWLAWCRADRTSALTGRGQQAGIVLILLSLLMHEVAVSQQILVLWHGSAVVCLWGGLCLAFGATIFRKFLPATLVLLAMIPVPGLIRQQLSIPLQVKSAQIAQAFMSACGADAARDGCILSINGVNVAVAEACNGMRMAVSILLVIYAVCFSFRMRPWQKISVLSLTPLIAGLLNTVRLILTVTVYGQFSEETGAAFHDMSGWLIPLGFVGTVLMFSGRLQTIQSSNATSINRESWIRRPLVTSCASVLIIAITVVNSYGPPSGAEVTAHQQEVRQLIEQTPYAVGNWVGEDAEFFEEALDLVHPIVAVRRRYRNMETGKRVTLVAFASEHARDLVGHEPGICFVGQGWTTMDRQPAQWQFGDRAVNGRYYTFAKQKGEHSVQSQVTSVLVTPGGESSGDTRDVAKAASDYRLEPFGAMAIQLQSIHHFDDETWHQLSADFAAQFLPAIRAYERCSRM